MESMKEILKKKLLSYYKKYAQQPWQRTFKKIEDIEKLSMIEIMDLLIMKFTYWYNYELDEKPKKIYDEIIQLCNNYFNIWFDKNFDYNYQYILTEVVPDKFDIWFKKEKLNQNSYSFYIRNCKKDFKKWFIKDWTKKFILLHVKHNGEYYEYFKDEIFKGLELYYTTHKNRYENLIIELISNKKIPLNIWFNKNKYPYEKLGYLLIRERCKDFNMWFDKSKFKLDNYYSVLFSKYCYKKFDDWFDKENFDYIICSIDLIKYVPEKFDIWFDDKKINYKEVKDLLKEKFYDKIHIWNTKRFREETNEILLKVI